MLWCECESSLWETSDSYRAQHFECLWLRWGGRAGNDCEQRKRIIHRKMWDIGNWVTKHLRPIVLCFSSAIQYVKALLFLILARSSSKSRGHRVTLDIDFCFCFIAPYSRRSCGPQTLTPPRLPSVHSMLSLSRNKLSGIRIRSVIHFFLLTNESCHVLRCLRIEIWFADYRRLSRARRLLVICCFWRDCHYSRCGTMMCSWLWWGCCGAPIHDCVVIVYWVLVAAVRYARTW